ncbi:MAG: hypothetical protein HOK06_08285 [Rhodospirillaceae bacterium]|jgi:hypothetical protein|nr:hypothetical protein [Rhodospirillaceae bacterium]MBT4464841.1 hypothetical protein [Rhodospirillaceae bacterium]MBT6407588.1 hypothetical protein [Rhodospirillaceae bacterium]MBT7356668.1 hypothetical protein [Rhodospirillaceae bacterium]
MKVTVNRNPYRTLSAAILAAALVLLTTTGTISTATAQESKDASDAPPSSVTHQMYLDMKLGKLNIHGDNAVVEALVLQRNIPITYDYIATLMRTPNAFGNGPACIVCHSSNNPAKSYRGLDLSSCEGILRGVTEEPPRNIITPGNPENSLLVSMIRNNRMPLGVPFFSPVNTDSITAIKDWIDKGAKNDENFNTNILPLFSKEDAFGGDVPCIECHKSFRDPPSFNEVNLSSYEAIMKGAWSKTRGKEGRPGLPIVVPFESADSSLYRRLTSNRMPPGVDPGEDSNHPNTQLLMRWIEQGAWCK